MSQKENIKKAFAEAEKDQQEDEIAKIKKIVQSHLERIQNKKEARIKLDDEIKHLEKDLYDLKSGRLDRINERHEKDEKAREVRIIIVEKIEKEYVPYYPWRSPWVIKMSDPWYPTYYATNTAYALGSGTTTISTASTSGTAFLNMTATGTQLSNFVGGSYEVGNKVINL